MQSFEIEFNPLPRRTCKIRVGKGTFDELVAELIACPPGRPLVLISDDNVEPLYGTPLAQRLRERGAKVLELSFPAGEAHKIRETKTLLEDRLFDLGVGRDAAIVAVGGGVTGDLAGFVAATWQRGIPVIHVPTSLLSMADAALGGKTAVNLPGGKNLIGSFHQPLSICADVSVLSTLEDRFYVEGFAEVVKAAVIADSKFFNWLELSRDRLLDRQAEPLEHAVATCMAIKGRVVKRDEREAGRRAVLNFGHTVGHAIETVSGYTIRHGRAVSIGLCAESRLAHSETGFSRKQAARLEALLTGFGLPTRIPSGLSIDSLVEATYRDKKAREGVAHYALPTRIGRMLPGKQVTLGIDESLLRTILGELREAS